MIGIIEFSYRIFLDIVLVDTNYYTMTYRNDHLYVENKSGLFLSAFCIEWTNNTFSTVSGFNDDLRSLINRPPALNWRSTPADVAGIEKRRLANFDKYGSLSWWCCNHNSIMYFNLYQSFISPISSDIHIY